MSVTQDEPIDEVENDGDDGEKPSLPRQFSAIRGFVPVEEGECPGSDEQRRRKNREAAKDNHDGNEHRHDD